jgi:hypothetical protein
MIEQKREEGMIFHYQYYEDKDDNLEYYEWLVEVQNVDLIYDLQNSMMSLGF